MDLLIDVLLLMAAWVLVERSRTDRDEVWSLCLKILATVSVLAVITSQRGLPLGMLLLMLALSLPSAARLERLRGTAPGNVKP
ncbi:MAG: hypothetical protein VKI83_11180 [Synechococcaceae cyanobacterium]|nr:hypothetical protein [Synechococcaceae cyanobacterium]